MTQRTYLATGALDVCPDLFSTAQNDRHHSLQNMPNVILSSVLCLSTLCRRATNRSHRPVGVQTVD